jgi:hypothetical protein
MLYCQPNSCLNPSFLFGVSSFADAFSSAEYVETSVSFVEPFAEILGFSQRPLR